METFQPYLDKVDDDMQLARVSEVLAWVGQTFPQLGKRIAWNQPMFTDHGTFIIGFSRAKGHLAVAPEYVALQKLSSELDAAGYNHTTMLFRIPWDKPVDYDLLRRIIEFNIADKAETTTFWRKND